MTFRTRYRLSQSHPLQKLLDKWTMRVCKIMALGWLGGGVEPEPKPEREREPEPEPEPEPG